MSVTPVLYTPEALANLYPFRANTWRMWVCQGWLPGVYVGRRVFIRAEDLQTFLAANTSLAALPVPPKRPAVPPAARRPRVEPWWFA